MSKSSNQSKGNNKSRGYNKNNKNQGDSKNVRSYNDEARGSSSKFPNDPSWYFTDAEFMKQTTSISFNQFTGMPFSLNADTLQSKDVVHVPSIMKVLFNPSIGCVPKTFARMYGINLAAYKLYTELSSINAKTTKYAPQDLATLILAFGNVLAYKSFIERAFGLVYLGNVRNRAVPHKLLESMGLDYKELISGLADYRIQYNTIMATLSSIPVPSNISYFDKCAGMFSNIYLDEDSAMAQLIVPAPKHVWKLEEAVSDQGSQLTAVPVHNLHMDAHLDNLFDMVWAIKNSATFNDIYSDILNYSSKFSAPRYAVSMIPENYVVIPQYNALYSLMIHNSRAIGDPIALQSVPNTLDTTHDFSDGLNVAHDRASNVLWSNPVFSRSSAGFDADCILDFPYDNPSVEEIVEATRYMSTCKEIYNSNTAATAKFYSASTPDWYVTEYHLYDDTGSDTTLYSVGGDTNMAHAAAKLTKFNKCPLFYHVASGELKGIVGDVQYYTTLPSTYLERINDAAMLTEFTVR